MRRDDEQSQPLPNAGVDYAGRCLLCGRKVESTGGCECRRTRVPPDAAQTEGAGRLRGFTKILNDW